MRSEGKTLEFHHVIEDSNTGHYSEVKQREAVRAIIMSNNNILLVQSSRGDFKFPGGGVEKGESHTEALIREVSEETGFISCFVQEKAGTVIERRLDEFENEKLFQMISHYYACILVDHSKVELKLDDYESELDFTPRWVSLKEAIEQNESLINQFEKNSWLQRETFVLREIKKCCSTFV